MKHLFDTQTSDFKCKHCHNYVSTDPGLSGVNNRNHCPYCLWYKHLDLYASGDRLAACKSEMRPIALTFKRTSKKYGQQKGELMLVHQCTDCGSISINRIAADDNDERILEIYLHSLRLSEPQLSQIKNSGIQMVGAADETLMRARLFGVQEGYRSTLSFA